MISSFFNGVPLLIYAVPVILLFLVILAGSTIKILREYERAVVFTLGRFQRVKGPGLVLLFPFAQEMVRVDLRIQVVEIPSQDVISHDNVSMKVDSVLYFNVVNPEHAIIQVQNYLPATNMLAQTTLRSVLGQHDLDEMLSERKKLSTDVQAILDTQTETWGIKVSNVEIRTVELTDNMVKAIAKQAEAERDRRAKIIHAEAEFQASQTLVNAAKILGSIPAAMQLRYLQTLTEIGGEQNSTIVFPMPIDIIRPFLDILEKADKGVRPNGASAADAHLAAYPPEKDVSPPVEHLLGDLGGIRTNLEGHGVNLLLDATTEFAGNFSGGVKRGSTFANQVGLEADVDWQRLTGLVGLSTHVIVVNRSGSSDSHLFGDDFLPVQEIYGSGGNVAIHLVSAYAEESLFGRRLDVAAGRMNVENDFGSSPLYCQFMNNALCGDPKALPGGDIGHSAFPDAVWAGRVRVHPTPVTSFKAGVYEVNQGLYSDANFRSGFKFDTFQDSGVYLPIEAAYEPLVGLSRMPGHYKIGFGYDTSPVYGGFAVKPSAAASNVSGVQPSRRNGNTQAWFLLDQMVLRQGPSDIDGIIILAGFVHNDPNNSAYAEQYFAGALDRGFWPARPHDAIGLLVTHNTASRVLGRVQSREAALGLLISNGASGPQTHETVVELNYDVHVAQGLTFRPELQYVRRPNAQASIPSAVVFGFKAHVEF